MTSENYKTSGNPSPVRRRILSVLLMFCLLNIPLIDSAIYASGSPGATFLEQADPYYQNYSPQQLDNLLAPIALYPDPLLAQVLPAATFPDQIEDAARYVRAYGANGIDDQYWDVSVKAVAHYPAVLYMMAERMDWTTATGQAYVYQSTDVMMAVQRLRGMAHAQGNLYSTPQQEVIVYGGYITIIPAQPRYVYVPVYDPAFIYYRHAHTGGAIAIAISFGAGFAIGAWLNRDCDWRYHRVYYHGWDGGGWVGRSRPVVHVTNVYVNNSYANINVNRTVINRHVDYTSINRYNSVHHDVTFDNHTHRQAPDNSGHQANERTATRNMNERPPQMNNRSHGEGNQGHPPSGKQVPQAAKTHPQSPENHAPTQSIHARSRSDSHSADRGGDKGVSGQRKGEPHSQGNQVRKAAPKDSKDSESETKHQENSSRKQM